MRRLLLPTGCADGLASHREARGSGLGTIAGPLGSLVEYFGPPPASGRALRSKPGVVSVDLGSAVVVRATALESLVVPDAASTDQLPSLMHNVN